jgi:hypothetical protein
VARPAPMNLPISAISPSIAFAPYGIVDWLVG